MAFKRIIRPGASSWLHFQEDLIVNYPHEIEMFHIINDFSNLNHCVLAEITHYRKAKSMTVFFKFIRLASEIGYPTLCLHVIDRSTSLPLSFKGLIRYKMNIFHDKAKVCILIGNSNLETNLEYACLGSG